MNFIGKKLKDIEIKSNELAISLKKIDKKLRENMDKVKTERVAEAYSETQHTECVWNSRNIDEE